ncbi:hypothetical protein OESDEN_09659 [Oesophagostomum dentatum]|uniref:Uncharacterized protein n=1 Tax=Oesophagostomum dentatum TaxID=61180 RepID=A0A0B1SYV4_OESDE|nr:hypothetical protein OESDEN_09659 [Oesophagostomum dentatum]
MGICSGSDFLQFFTDEDLESVIGETKNGEWLPLKDDKENNVPTALRLDPDEVDKKDTDYDDYCVFEGGHYRISKKDEEAFKELHWLNYGFYLNEYSLHFAHLPK